MTSKICYYSNNEFIFNVKKKSSSRRFAKVLNTTVSNSALAMVRDFDVIGIGAWQTVYALVALDISETLSVINTVEMCKIHISTLLISESVSHLYFIFKYFDLNI